MRVLQRFGPDQADVEFLNDGSGWRKGQTGLLPLRYFIPDPSVPKQPARMWWVSIEAENGDPDDATYLEVQAKTEREALKAAHLHEPRLPLSRFKVLARR